MGEKMRKIVLALAGGAALAGCSSEEDRLENAMRETLAAQGNVQQVEMTKADENRMTGFAVVRRPDGQEGRLNCNADRDASKGSSYFNWRCVPAIDDQLIENIENSIRTDIAQRGTVREVEMQKQSEDRMTGFVTASDTSGEVRLECEATRDSDGANFSWRCEPPAQAGGK